jgi:uncharacterized protein YjiS (DUF1127 family)
LGRQAALWGDQHDSFAALLRAGWGYLLLRCSIRVRRRKNRVRKDFVVNTHTLLHYESYSPLALLRSAAKYLRELVSSQLERQRLYKELSLLDDRELIDIGIQRSDIDLLVHGKSIPIMERRAHRYNVR